MNEASDHSTTSVRAVDVFKRYGGTEAEVVALRGVSFDVRAGERVALLGKSGSGKSTLLNLLGGLDRPSSGELRVAGQPIGALSSAGLTRFRAVSVGMIFQGFNLIASRTALSNVELPMVFTGQPKRQRLQAARDALEAVGLGRRLNHHPSELSGGECQRVAVARALVNRPAVLLADEPTGNLDSATASEVMSYLLAHVRDHGATMILVTHDEELARASTERIVRLRDGEIVSE